MLTGQATTGRIITAAAAIMTVVFFAFTFTTDRTVKMIGLGMAAAVVADALIVRTVLVPAVMHMLGKTNWRIPAVLDRVLPRLDLEGGSEAGGASETAEPTSARSAEPDPAPGRRPPRGRPAFLPGPATAGYVVGHGGQRRHCIRRAHSAEPVGPAATPDNSGISPRRTP